MEIGERNCKNERTWGKVENRSEPHCIVDVFALHFFCALKRPDRRDFYVTRGNKTTTKNTRQGILTEPPAKVVVEVLSPPMSNFLAASRTIISYNETSYCHPVL